MADTKDEITPAGRWEFGADVTDVFDDMLARSIPEYERMRELTTDLARRFLRPQTTVLDLGTSRGEALARLRPSQHADTRFVGVEISTPMIAAARDRFDGYGNVTILEHDLRSGLPTFGGYAADVSVVMAVLVVMFTPIEYRMRLVDQIRASLADGGAFIFVEKVLGGTAETDQLLVDAYYDTKREQGYTEEQIQRKRLSLEGVLVPVTAAWNEHMLTAAGFRTAECFWRSLNFAGWIALR